MWSAILPASGHYFHSWNRNHHIGYFPRLSKSNQYIDISITRRRKPPTSAVSRSQCSNIHAVDEIQLSSTARWRFHFYAFTSSVCALTLSFLHVDVISSLGDVICLCGNVCRLLGDVIHLRSDVIILRTDIISLRVNVISLRVNVIDRVVTMDLRGRVGKKAAR